MSENKEKLPEGVTHFVASVVWVMAGLALVVALPGLLIVEPHDFQSAVQFAVAAATVFILASWARHASPKTTVDFEQERIKGTEVDLEIDNISCVALIAQLSNPDQDHTPGHARYEVHVGTGDIEPASLKDTFTVDQLYDYLIDTSGENHG